ncbi:hypothetical protein AAVH_08414 [Aphelenchoides avenae]|nr:hypothetical protein AAVH_08414 [Aphelenchus avenae]
MPYKVFRLVKREALSTETLLEILLRMCPECDGRAFDAYFGDTQYDEVPLGFCENCPFNKPPEGTDDGCAFPLVEYLCWVYICSEEMLPHVLAVHHDQLDELLKGQVLVIEEAVDQRNYATADYRQPTTPPSWQVKFRRLRSASQNFRSFYTKTRMV